jgi:hypothetical protein
VRQRAREQEERKKNNEHIISLEYQKGAMIDLKTFMCGRKRGRMKQASTDWCSEKKLRLELSR